MKKTLNYTKKTISLFLAVLMILSCWVWVAPEKAEAAGYTGYTITVNAKVSDQVNGGTAKCDITFNDGSTTTWNLDKWESDTGTYDLSSSQFTKWPKKLVFTVDQGGARTQNVAINSIKINGQTILEGTWTMNPGWWSSNTKTFESNGSQSSGGDTGSPKTNWWPTPAPQIDGTANAGSDISFTLNKLGDTNIEKKPGGQNAEIQDQYGVKWPSYNKEAFLATDEDATINKALTNSNSPDIYYDSASGKIIAKPTLQSSNLLATGESATYYFIRSTNIKDSSGLITTEYRDTAKVTVSYPNYITTFNPHGSTPTDVDVKIEITDKDGKKTQASTWSYGGYYATEPSSWPTGVATKSGYKFKGFWTANQPDSTEVENNPASFHAYAANFAEPISSTQFDTYKTKGGEVNGKYITIDGKTYYNAGEQWNPEKREARDAIYYGWWISEEIPVKFYDIDGKYLGNRTYKYGWTLESQGVPTPTGPIYNAGAYEYKDFTNTWMDITGIVLGLNYKFEPSDIEEYSLTPIYETKTYKDKYTITFVVPKENYIDMPSKEYPYRAEIPNADIPADVYIPEAIRNSPDYSYAFEGWTTEVPTNGFYHIITEDDASFSPNIDWLVRDNAVYYPVYRSTLKSYVVTYTYTDTTGTVQTVTESVPYGATISTPDYVNRTYAAGGKGYNLEGWEYLVEKEVKAVLGVHAYLAFNTTNFYITDKNLADGVDETAIEINAVYDAGTAMPYNITFKYKGANGENVIITEQVKHEEFIKQETVDKLDVPEKYETDEAQYAFSGRWKVTEGTADKAEYVKEEFTSFSPTSHVTFEAVYSEGTPFYTVKYIDGTLSYTEKILQGSNVPAWMVFTGELDENGKEKYEVYVPADKETSTGINKFAGWYNEKQTDETCKETNGTEYTTKDTVTGNLTLYAQYKYEAFKYTITFLDYKGVQLESGEYEAGQSFADAFYRANKAAQYRDPDETYAYDFIGWDQPYDEAYLVCEGKDVTYTALYKPRYVYYDAEWYNDIDAINNGEDPVTTTHHTYNGKVFNPSVKLTPPAAAQGKTNVFAGWYYIDADGEAQAFVRGMAIKSDMKFYATYAEVSEPHTVTVVVGEKTETYIVADGEKATAVPTPVAIYNPDYYEKVETGEGDYILDNGEYIPDENGDYILKRTHSVFDGWYTDSDFRNSFDIENTAITANITIYAKLKEEEHTMQRELVSVPTYYKEGSEKIWCECNKEKTSATVVIPVLSDKVAPTGTIYLGSASWSSTETDETKTGAGDTNIYFANKDTDIILTINDTGDINDAFNPSGKGKGIRMIRAFVSSDNFTQAQQGIASQLAITIYPTDGIPDTSETQNNTANYAFKLGDLVTADLDDKGNVQYDEDGRILTKELEDGQEYIIYYYAIDKANNVLNKNVRTAKFVYDISAPSFKIEGDSNASKDVPIYTYCSKAVIKGIENEATVTVNGEEVELTTAGVSGATSYTINKAGNYVITITDKAGNSTTKKIIVTEDHTVVKTEFEVTCNDNGYYSESCAICGKTLKYETVESEGHKWVDEAPIEATCTTDKKTVKVCSVCGEKSITVVEDSALGHGYKKDENGNIIYKVTIEAKCNAEGRKIAYCVRCNEIIEEISIPVDPDAHNWSGIKTLKPTCTEPGKYYKGCKYCFITVDEGDPIPATGHQETYKVVTQKATCGAAGVETEYCKKCDFVMGTTDVPATGKHIWEVSSDPDKTYEATADKEGKITYECKTCDAEYFEVTDKILKHTVTIYADDGETVLYTIPGVINGTTISEGYKWTVTTGEGEDAETKEYTLTLPTKESDNKYSYTFAGWADKNGKAVEFPLDVMKDMEIKATYKATTIIYTHKFLVPTKWTATLSATESSNVEYAEIIGEYGDMNKRPGVLPEFKDSDEKVDAELKKAYKITFDYWATSNGEKVTDFTMRGNGTFIAVFKAEPIKYNVTFYQSKNDITPWATQVGYGDTVVYGGETPEYPANDSVHYIFAGWMLGNSVETNELTGELGPIIADTRYVATYTEQAHTYEVVLDETKTWAASCTREGQKTEKCSVCGYEKITIEPMLEHNYEDQTDGSKKCSLCGDVVKPDAKIVTVTFKKGETEILKEVKLTQGKTYTYTAPEKITTDEYVYTFTGWFDAEGNEITKNLAIEIVAGDTDAVYTASYSREDRLYNVTYFDWDHKVIKTYPYAYGAQITHSEPAALERSYDASVYGKHYSFKEWRITKGTLENGKVVGDVEIYAIYNEEAHFFVEDTLEATCQTPGGVRMVCICGYSYPVGSEIPKVPHTEGKVISNVEPTIHANGKYVYECGMCGKEQTKILPQLDKTQIAIQVYDGSGKIGDYVTVEIFYTVIENGKNKEVQYKESYKYITDAKGYILIDVPAKYSGWKAKIYLRDGSYSGALQTGGVLNQFGEKAVEDTSTAKCSCSCHKPFIGFFYRLIQMLIRFFGGRPCCVDYE